ncbi:hypothetical protein J6590_002346 [Homalodisca vitripennis]|nr:hypothetical protein J6590_002346 [Homalodisca vitripennis]
MNGSKIFFRNYKKIYKKVIQAAKVLDASKSILSSKNVSKTTWGIINNKTNAHKQIKIKVGNRLVEDEIVIASRFNEFLASVADGQGPRPSDPKVRPSRRQSPAASMGLAPVVEDELQLIIQQLPAKKSNDLNLMSPWLIKKYCKHLVRPLTQLVNYSFQQEFCSSKFLGMYLDRGLTWNEHIDHVCAKICSGICFNVFRKILPESGTDYGVLSLDIGYPTWPMDFQSKKRKNRIITKIKFRELCRQVFKKLQLSTLPCQDIHMYETRGRANYRTVRHRTVVYERLPLQAGVTFLNRLPNSIKDAPTPKAFKTRLKRLLSQAFYNAGEFLAFNWEPAQLED